MQEGRMDSYTHICMITCAYIMLAVRLSIKIKSHKHNHFMRRGEIYINCRINYFLKREKMWYPCTSMKKRPLKICYKGGSPLTVIGNTWLTFTLTTYPWGPRPFDWQICYIGPFTNLKNKCQTIVHRACSHF